MRFGHVLRQRGRFRRRIGPDMRSHPHPAVENLHGLRRQVHVHLLMHQRVRHAVEVPPHLDVIVDIYAGRLPFPELEARGR